mgnify:CR=1 FL=1
MFKQPDPGTLALRLRTAINNNTPPTQLFYEFLSSGTMEANFLHSKMCENREVIRIITSPQGRAWIKRNLDVFLNYLEKF